jgi:hypothetical protein
VQCSCIDDPLASQIAGLKKKPFIAPAKHRSLASLVHQDQRLRTGAAGYGRELRLDTGAGKRIAMQTARIVLTQLWQATTVVAACPPGNTDALRYSTLEPRAG